MNIPKEIEQTKNLSNMERRKKSEKKVTRFGNVKRFRHEYKYMIDAKQEVLLNIKAMSILQLDPYATQDGYYVIRSAYFDDIHDTCLAENLNGTDPRSKFRIRYYNSDSQRISLEKKSKVRGMCLKESCSITEDECRSFLEGKVPMIEKHWPEEKKKLFTEVRLRGLYPKVIVSYERIPYIYSGGNVRVTFDRNITSSTEVGRFLEGDYTTRPILPVGSCILEVKWDEIIPRHIKEVLKIEQLNWTAFSKYYMCRMFHL